MVIPKNRITAIVGESGSGKSTLVDLITGILNPTSGDICFDDINYRELDLESMRLMIGYVTQENVVFHDSIANNISLWKCQDDDSLCQNKVHNASLAAHCYEFVKEGTSGYQTIIGDRGIKLSGGQRQRLAIAREIFKEPEILILDEATSSLDSESESFIQKSIETMNGSKTIIIIAHRLSTIKNCDYMYILQKGRIVEEGSYDELSQRNTKFRKMCLEQQISLS
jgi:subfamily B ATP-binding cassette protein MsbA